VRELSFLAVVFLALSVACTEIPELLTILDDTSNDFVVTTSNSQLSYVQSPLQNVASTIPPDSDSSHYFCQLEFGIRLQVLLLSGRDLLTLHSLQKK
jgi:hypothetical protein